jgi:drug/metabolite transporter (DMT)-like permease
MNSSHSSHSTPAIPWLGIVVGLCAASIGALYTVFARQGLAQGLQPWDLTFLRFTTAGIALLPFVINVWRTQGPRIRAQWRVWLGVCVLAGPLFGLLMFGALQFAPPSHAAVFPFAAMSVMGMVLSAIVLGDRITLRKSLGLAIIIAGLVTLSGLSWQSLQARALVGDALFILAGTLWAGFGILLRRHKLSPTLATAVISFAALITFAPAYLAYADLSRLGQASASTLFTQILVQGLIAGCGTLYTYGKMVSILGPARAAVFPALAPGFAALLAWPVLGALPGSTEVLGILLATLGLGIATTQFRFPFPTIFLAKASS